jgi:hypothetical protein
VKVLSHEIVPRGLLTIAAVAGCRVESTLHASMLHETIAHAAPSAVAAPAGEPARQMTISVAEVTAVPALELDAIRAPLRAAEAALLSCVDPDGSTGVVAMKIALEGDGFVGGIGLRDLTTYGSDDARACLMRLVGAMRFPTPATANAEVDVTLDVSTRFPAP